MNNTEKRYEEGKETLKNEIIKSLEISIVCIAVDMWQDNVNKIHYLGMNIHYLKRDSLNKLVLESKVMALKSFDAEDRKTGHNINRATMKVIKEYELESHIDSIVFITDRGTNMISAYSDYTRYNCINHMCNNIVAHAIEPVNSLISKVARVVKYMKVTGLNSKLSKNLESHVPTRWHTVTKMTNSFISLYREIRPKITNPEIVKIFDEISYRDLVSLRDYLEPYQFVSKETEGDKDVTCVKILPLIETILSHNHSNSNDSATVKSMKKLANTYIKSDILPSLPIDYKQWAFFHPAWKKMDSFKTVKHSDIVDQVKSSVSCFDIGAETQQEETITTAEETSKSIFANLQDSTPASVTYDAIAAEFDDYINCNVPNALKINLINWWDENQSRFPRLYKKFLTIAPIVASSASSERMFSTAGSILTKKRNRLSSDHVEQLLFLNKNLN